MASAPTPDLSRTEWQAVAIALKDAANGPCAVAAPAARPRLGRRLYTLLTGNAPRRPLADPRLEAIRGFVCDARRTHALPAARVPLLEQFGFNRAQIEALALLSA